MSAYSTSPTSVLRPTKLGLWNPLEGGAPWCSHQSLWGRVKVGYRDPQATGKTFTIPTIHHTHEYRDGKATAAARIRPSSHNLQPKQTQQAKLGGEGPGRVGGGLAGSGAYLPLQEEQVATVLSGAPSFLCTLPLAAFSRQSSLGRPGPMAQTPDGISCELRGKPCLALPGSPAGLGEVA